MNHSGRVTITPYKSFTALFFSALSETSGCFAAKVDFRADLRQSPRMEKQKNARKQGRPAGSKLDRPEYQRLLSLAIARSGKPEGCWAGICSERLFVFWKSRNRKRWETLRDTALAEYSLQASLSSPRLLETAVNQLKERLERGELSERVLFEVVKYFDARRNETK